MSIKPDFSLYLALTLILILFGIGYNALVSWMERAKVLEGFTSLAVALGVLVTVGVTAFVNWQFALVTLAAFVASGLPMIAGSIIRYVKARKQSQEDIRHE